MKAYEEVAEFIAKRGPREVSEFKPSPEVRQCVWELLEREKAASPGPPKIADLSKRP